MLCHFLWETALLQQRKIFLTKWTLLGQFTGASSDCTLTTRECLTTRLAVLPTLDFCFLASAGKVTFLQWLSSNLWFIWLDSQCPLLAVAAAICLLFLWPELALACVRSMTSVEGPDIIQAELHCSAVTRSCLLICLQRSWPCGISKEATYIMQRDAKEAAF